MFSELSGVRILFFQNIYFFTLRESRFQIREFFCFWNPESGKFLLMKSGIPGFGIQNTVHGIRNTTNAD